MNKAHKELLKKNLTDAVKAYEKAFLELIEGAECYGYWVGDDVTGAYCYGDDLFLNLTDMVLCVEEGITMTEITEWQDYNTWAHENGQTFINLRSWHMGYHGVPKEIRDRIDAQKRELDELIKESKEKY